jgi:hypothetical protein
MGAEWGLIQEYSLKDIFSYQRAGIWGYEVVSVIYISQKALVGKGEGNMVKMVGNMIFKHVRK